MSETATLQLVHTTGDGERLGTGALVSVTADQLVKEDVALINGTKTATISIKFASLKSIYCLSDKAVTMVFKTSAPADNATVVLAPNIPWSWNDQDPSAANPLSANIATIACTAAAGGTLQIRVMQNAVA